MVIAVVAYLPLLTIALKFPIYAKRTANYRRIQTYMFPVQIAIQ